MVTLRSSAARQIRRRASEPELKERMRLAQAINEAVVRSGRNAFDIAETIGVVPSALSHWRSGRRSPDGPQIRAFCAAIGISADDLLDVRGRVAACDPRPPTAVIITLPLLKMPLLPGASLPKSAVFTDLSSTTLGRHRGLNHNRLYFLHLTGAWYQGDLGSFTAPKLTQLLIDRGPNNEGFLRGDIEANPDLWWLIQQEGRFRIVRITLPSNDLAIGQGWNPTQEAIAFQGLDAQLPASRVVVGRVLSLRMDW